jgi:hypothetical protein
MENANISDTNPSKSKITSILNHMKNFSQQYLTIATFVGIIWGGFAVYGNWKENNKDMQNKVKTIIDSQIRQRQADSLLLDGQLKMKAEFEAFKIETQAKQGTLNSLQKSYVKYIGNDPALTKKDFLEYMEGLTVEEKKN